MKVKIGDKIFSSNDEAIMLIFDNEEHRMILINNLISMPIKKEDSIRKYAEFPIDKYTLEEKHKFMEINIEESSTEK